MFLHPSKESINQLISHNKSYLSQQGCNLLSSSKNTGRYRTLEIRVLELLKNPSSEAKFQGQFLTANPNPLTPAPSVLGSE
jgi:hypothetical protein